MEWINNLLESTKVPIIVAFLLGLMTAISPCPLATNITAIGYISKDIENRNKVLLNGLLYTLGRILSYSVLGVILIYVLQKGTSTFGIQKSISKYDDIFLPPALLLFGLFILFSDKINLPSFGFKGEGKNIRIHDGFGSLLLGMLFALAFCPTSGVFYFGILIPMSTTTVGGYFLPAVFALATGLPVIIIALILAYSVNSIGRFYGNVKKFQRWFNIIVGILCICVSIYYVIVEYF